MQDLGSNNIEEESNIKDNRIPEEESFEDKSIPTYCLETKQDVLEALLKGNIHFLREQKASIAKVVRMSEDCIIRYLEEYDEILDMIRKEEELIDEDILKKFKTKQKLEAELCLLLKESCPAITTLEKIKNIEKKLGMSKMAIDKLRITLNKCILDINPDFCCKFLNTTKSNLYKMKSELKSRLGSKAAKLKISRGERK